MSQPSATVVARTRKWAIVVHGGAGAIERGALTPEQEAAYRQALARTAEAGAAGL
jgi:beta-aspartyl-peptidase (threonine type)